MVYCLYDEYHACEGSESLPCLVAYIKGLSQITPGPRTASKNVYWSFPYGARPAPFRFHGRRDNLNNPYGRRCVKDAAPNSPGVLFKPVARKQPVKNPAGYIRGPAGKRPGTARFLLPILVNIYNGNRTVSKGAGRLPFRARADP